MAVVVVLLTGSAVIVVALGRGRATRGDDSARMPVPADDKPIGDPVEPASKEGPPALSTDGDKTGAELTAPFDRDRQTPAPKATIEVRDLPRLGRWLGCRPESPCRLRDICSNAARRASAFGSTRCCS